MNLTPTPPALWPLMDLWRCGSPGANESSDCTGEGEGEGERSFVTPSFSTAAKVRVSVTLLLFIASACSNAAVLWTVSRRGRQRSHIKLLIMNLAVADLLVTVIVMPLDAVWNITVQWYAGDLSCRLLMFLKLVAMYSSAFVTVVISVDRQAAILNPLAIGDAKKRNKLLLCGAWALSITLALPQVPPTPESARGAWALSITLALPQLFLFHTVSRSRPVPFVQCSTLGSFRQHWQETLYNMLTFACLFLLPLFTMVLCYSRILHEISGKRRRRRRMRGAGDQRRGSIPVSSREIQLRRSSDNIPRARLRTLKLSLVLVLSFILCWTPYYLLGLWYWFCPEMLTSGQVPPSLSHILFPFGLLNSSLNPLFYGLFTLHFHREVRKARPDPDTPSLGTGSFRCSPLHQQRGARDRPETPNSPCSSLCKGSVEESLV